MQNILNLDQCVLNALQLFKDQNLPSLKLPSFKRSLVVGSGNAAIVGKILFEDQDAVFADESTYLQKLNTIKNIDGCILISASGGKHAPIVAKELNKRKKKVILLTTNVNAPAREYVDEMVVFPKQSEPYTYNTSTYLGMILSKTKENPKIILKSIQKIKTPHKLKKYDAFFLIVPPEFELIREMFLTKFDELFGSKVLGRVFTLEQAKHAKTIISSDKELFISFGWENKLFGKNRWNVSLPQEADYGTLMAIGYYVIGQIQK
ncbi:MAG: hypothetical protein Q7K45_03155, partial [Nanoarchaeota archaeon]|nr:hypothetical protein [Nanoarchaeota archaeon]